MQKCIKLKNMKKGENNMKKEVSNKLKAAVVIAIALGLVVPGATVLAKTESFGRNDPILPNDPPNTPDQPDGPTEGEVGIEYCYTTNTTDPDGDRVYYKWDWGDEVTDWIGPFIPGKEVEECHTWNLAGTYNVKVKAKDIYDHESDWSEALEVTIVQLELEIGEITGGLLKVDAEIKNAEDVDITDVNYSLKVEGGLLGMINAESAGTIDIKAGKTVIVTAKPIVGFGPVTITVKASADGTEKVKQVDGFVILFVVIIK